MYNPIQLARDLKIIAGGMGESIPHGFFTKRVFDCDGLYIELSHDGLQASYQGVLIDIHNFDIDSKLAQYILKLVISHEEKYSYTIIKHQDGVTTIYG